MIVVWLLMVFAISPSANAEILSDAPEAELISRLSSCDPRNRRQVISELAQRGNAVYADIFPLLGSPRACAKDGAAAAIEGMGPDVPDSELIRRIAACRSDKAEQTQFEIGRRGSKILPAIIPLLDSPQACVRYGGLASLQAIGLKSRYAAETTALRHLDDPDRKTRSLALDIVDGTPYDQEGGWDGTDAAISTRSALRFTSQRDWNSLWKKLYGGRFDPPPVAFSKNMVVAFFAGQRHSDYSISMTTRREPDGTHISADISYHLRRDSHKSSINFDEPRFGMVVLPKSAGRVFVEETQTPVGSFAAGRPITSIVAHIAAFEPLDRAEWRGIDSPDYARKHVRLHQGLEKRPPFPPREKVQRLWSIPPARTFDQRTEIAFGEGKIFLLGSSMLSAVSLRSGAELWRIDGSSGMPSGSGEFAAKLSADRKQVFFAVIDGANDTSSIAAVDSDSGRLRWTRSLSSAELPRSRAFASTVSHGLVFVVAYQATPRTGPTPSPWDLLALDENDGQVRWERRVDQNISLPERSGNVDLYSMKPPAYENGTVYWTLPWGQIYAVRAASGEPLWTFSPESTTRSSSLLGASVEISHPPELLWSGTSRPIIMNDSVFFASPDGFVYSLKTADGKILWKKRVGGNVCLSLGNVGSKICWVLDGMTCLKARDGETLWEAKPSRHAVFDESQPPIYVDGKIWVGKAGNVVSLNPETGRIVDDLDATPLDDIEKLASDGERLYIWGPGLTQLTLPKNHAPGRVP